MATRTETIVVEAKRRGNGFKELADELGKMDKAAGSADERLGHIEKTSQRLDTQIKKTKESIKEMGQEFDRTGDSGVLDRLSKQTSELQRLEKAAQQLKKLAPTGNNNRGILDDILGGIPSMGGVPPQLIAGGAAVGLAIAPPIAAAVAGAVAGTVGAGGVIGGLLLATRDARVKSELSHLGDVFFESMMPAQNAFVQPALDAFSAVERELQGGQFANTLAAAAPLAGEFVSGVLGGVDKAAAGLEKMFRTSGPLFKVWAEEFPQVGEAVGDFFESLTADAPGAAKGVKLFFDTVEVGTRQLGQAVTGLTALNDLMQMPGLSKGIEAIPWFGAIGVAGAAVEALKPQVSSLQPIIRDATGATVEASEATKSWVDSIWSTVDGINALSGTLSDFYGPALNAEEIISRQKHALLDLKESVKEHGTSLSDNTEQGLRNQDMLRGLVQGYIDERDANLARNVPMEQANALYQQQIADLIALAGKLGFNKDLIYALVAAYKAIPTRITTEIIQQYYTTGTPAGEHSGIRATERASGGPVVPGMPYMINERGKETVTFPAGGTVHPANLTPVGSMGGNVTVIVNVPVGASLVDAGAQMVAALKQYDMANGTSIVS